MRLAIDSINQQTFRDLDIVLVNDGSTDNTVEEATRTTRRPLSVISTAGSPQGVAAALNVGLATIDSKYVVRFDADDIMLPGRVERQIQLLEDRPGLTATAGNFRAISPHGRPLLPNRLPLPLNGDEVTWLLGHCNPIVHPSVTFQRNAIEKYPEDEIFEDYALWLSNSSSWRWLLDPAMAIEWRMSERSASQTGRTAAASSMATMLAAHWADQGKIISESTAAHLIRPPADVEMQLATDVMLKHLISGMPPRFSNRTHVAARTNHQQWRARALLTLTPALAIKQASRWLNEDASLARFLSLSIINGIGRRYW